MTEPLRPAASQPKPHTYGPQVALVVGPEGQELWTYALGRVKVQFPWGSPRCQEPAQQLLAAGIQSVGGQPMLMEVLAAVVATRNRPKANPEELPPMFVDGVNSFQSICQDANIRYEYTLVASYMSWPTPDTYVCRFSCEIPVGADSQYRRALRFLADLSHELGNGCGRVSVKLGWGGRSRCSVWRNEFLPVDSMNSSLPALCCIDTSGNAASIYHYV